MKPLEWIQAHIRLIWTQASIRYIAAALILAAALIPLRHRAATNATLATQPALALNAKLTTSDTQTIHRATAAADTARANEQTAKHQLTIARARATRAANQADTLLTAVAVAPTESDTITTLTTAYDARTTEALALTAAQAPADDALAWADLQSDSLRSALHVSELRATRSDSLTQQLTTQLAQSTRCRMLHFIPCPSRRILAAALVAAVVVGRGR